MEKIFFRLRRYCTGYTNIVTVGETMKMRVSRILLVGYILFILIGTPIAYIWDTWEWNQRLKEAREYEQEHLGIKGDPSPLMIFAGFIFLAIVVTIFVVPQILWWIIKERKTKS